MAVQNTSTGNGNDGLFPEVVSGGHRLHNLAPNGTAGDVMAHDRATYSRISLSRPPFNWARLTRALYRRYPPGADFPLALVSVAAQRMYLVRRMNLIGSYRVSTSRFGTGSLRNTLRTPLGVHRVYEKIGEGCESLTLFKGRQPVGENARVNPFATISDSDAVCTRILWLEGTESGYNLGGYVDSLRRFIYIHGTMDERRIGVPSSIGCIRMRNDNVIEVFDALSVGSLIYIVKEKRAGH